MKDAATPTRRGTVTPPSRRHGRQDAGAAVVIALCFSLLSLTVPGQSGTGESVDDLLRLSQQLIAGGRLDEARKQLDFAKNRFPEDARIHNFLGVVAAQQGTPAEAESSFRRALSLSPRFAGAYLNLGRLYQQISGERPEALEKALATYYGLLQFDPENSEALYQAAVVLHRRGEYRESTAFLDRLPVADRERAQALAWRLANGVALGESPQAEAVALAMRNRFDLAEQDILVITPVLLEGGREDLSVSLLEVLATRGKLSVTGLEELASLHEKTENWTEARRVLASISPDFADPVKLLMWQARIASRQRDYHAALRYLAEARDLDPDNPQIHAAFGLACVQLELAVEAHNSLQKAVQLDPASAYYRYALGWVTLRWKDPADAIQSFQKYVEMAPDDAPGEAALAAAYYYNAEYERAGELFRRLVEVTETAAAAHHYLGLMAKLEGRTTEAIAHLAKTLELWPKNPDAYAELAHLNIRAREYDRAAEMLQAALRQDPHHYLAHFNLLLLYRRTKDPRAPAQQQKVEEVKLLRSQRMLAALRTIEIVRPASAQGEQ